MKSTVVQYRAKPERADENQELIEAVFDQLRERNPKGFNYRVIRLDDGVSFVHTVVEYDAAAPDSLQDVPAFQAFLAHVGERCEVAPVAAGAALVGEYGGSPLSS